MKLTLEEKEYRKNKRKISKYKEKHKTINNIIYKWCDYGEHWEVMDADHFYKNTSNSMDGLGNSCKKHESIKTQLWQINNNQQYRATVKKRDSNESEERKQYKRNLANEQRKSGYQVNYRKNNKNRVNNYNHKRLLNKKHIIYDDEWKACKKFFNYQCAYCGLFLNKHHILRNGKMIQIDFHKEHVVDNGRNDIKNCIPSCQSCNSKKNNRSFSEFYNINNKDFTYKRYHQIYLWLRYEYKKYILPKRRFKSQRLMSRLKEIETNKQNNNIKIT